MKMERCNKCKEQEILHTACPKCKELKEFNSLMSGEATEIPKIDFGEPVSADEKKALWSVDDEKRMGVVLSNGNNGDHYEHHALVDNEYR